MKRRLIYLMIGFLLGLALLLGCQAAAQDTAVSSANTYHWLLTAGDDAYILCDGGQFRITANGADSIYIECVAGAGESK